STHVEEVYQLDKSGALADRENNQAAKLVKSQLAKASSLLRDLAYTAWIESAKPPAQIPNPTLPSHPGYNPETGTAPPAPALVRGQAASAALAPSAQRNPAEPAHAPLKLESPVEDKNFWLFSSVERTESVRRALEANAALAKLRLERLAALASAARTCHR